MSRTWRLGRQDGGARKGLELWGGYECTVNRVGDQWFDQTPRSGHETRISDLELFADLGLKSLRYPALWERISPTDPEVRDFRWTDERLPRMLGLGISPILTLCHHGSGPHYTSLLDDNFAPGLARHAAAVAERYPWVDQWTPVNEPLTTARFSGLNGYWYPHATDERSCWLALLNEIDATRLSMTEIRKVNPKARLIATDDLGFCHATPPLQTEANFQNERRWLGWDLLCGMVKPGHALWDRLVACGLEDRLRTIADAPCPPDVIGVNHYLSSERYLDHRIERHRDRSVADRDCAVADGVRHVDVDAIRSLRDGVVGLPALLRQTCERYGRPVAVTECHMGGAREDQVRWFVDVWRGVEALRDEGCDIRAVTAWSLLGSFDWNRMVTQNAGHYEVGVYDVRSGEPRPTALARVLKDLAHGRQPEAIGLSQPGWWKRTARFMDAGPQDHQSFDLGKPRRDLEAATPLLIVGREGPLSTLLSNACQGRGIHYVRVSEAGDRLLDAVRPWGVVDARDWAGVTHDEAVAEDAAMPPFAPPEDLVRLCGQRALPCAVFSAANGLEEVDERLLALGEGHLVLARTEAVYTPWCRSRFAVRVLDALDAGLQVAADAGTLWDETYGPDLVDAVLDLMVDGAAGAFTMIPTEGWSMADYARRLAETAECDPGLVIAQDRSNPPASHPMTGLAPFLPSGPATLERFVRDSRWHREHDPVQAPESRPSRAGLTAKGSAAPQGVALRV